MTEPSFRFDEIGAWSVLKLNIIEKYGTAYTKAFNRRGSILKKYYIDGFSGAGVHVEKHTREQVEGSPTRALNIVPPFDGFYFIDMNKDKTDHLSTLCAGRTNVEIHNGDTNPYLRKLLPEIKYSDYKRALCILDPYGLHLDWEVIELAGQSGTIDMFLNFPIMDMNRNVIWQEPDKASAVDLVRMNRFWGDETWRDIAYVESKQKNLFFGPAMEKQSNDVIADAFRERLRKIAGFKYVPPPLPMRNSKKAIVYYLFFGSRKPVAEEIIKGIFKTTWRK